VRLQQRLEDETIDYDVPSQQCNRLPWVTALCGALHPLVPYARSLWRANNVKQ